MFRGSWVVSRGSWVVVRESCLLVGMGVFITVFCISIEHIKGCNGSLFIVDCS